MDESPKDAKRSPEKKPAPQANNLLWYLLALGVLVLLLATAFGTNDTLRLSMSDFERLIKASKPGPDGETDYILVDAEDETTGKQYMLRNPTKISVGSNEVTGMVEQTVKINAARLVKDGALGSDDASDGNKMKKVKFRVANLPYGVERLTALLSESGVEWDNVESPSPLLGYLPILMLTGMFVLLMVVMLRRMGGAGSPMAFGRSRGKLYAQEDIEVTFDDVAGIEEAVDELREVVDFLKNPERYHRLGGRIPKGVLL
ncbi:MAG: hypothetical protein KDA44_10650, partial [Planctomycetales bacterium]|nr:hypothetical protein [Planctomycetales bacterium]